MHHLNSWTTPDHRVMAIFAESVLITFARYRQLRATDFEAGGVLLGKRRGRHFDVTHLTVPFPTDVRTRTAFNRESSGHQSEASALWTSSGREIGYLGEWHSHPEQDPSPSNIDIRQWEKASTEMIDGLPFLAVIVGDVNLSVSIWQRGSRVDFLDSVI